VGVGEADSVAEGGVEVLAVEVAAVAVDSLPVEAEEDLLLGDAAEANLTLFSINEFIFCEVLYYIKVLHRNFLSIRYSVVRKSLLETGFQITRVKLMSESIYLQDYRISKDRPRSKSPTFLNIVYLIARKAWYHIIGAAAAVGMGCPRG